MRTICARGISAQDTNVRNAEARGLHLYAEFGVCADVGFVPGIQQKLNQPCLQIAMISLAQVSLLQLAVYIVAVGAKAVTEIFAERDECTGSQK